MPQFNERIETILSNSKTEYQKTTGSGHTVKTTLYLSDDIELTVTTRKQNDRLITTANAAKVKDGMIYHNIRHDYYALLLVTYPKRVTENTVRFQHNQVNLTDVVIRASAHYDI